MRICVTTQGGDAPGLNGVLRAVVRSAILNHGWEVFGIQSGLDGLIHDMDPIPLGLEEVRGILHLGGTIIGTSNSSHPFRFKTEAGNTDMSEAVIKNYKKHGFDAMIVIGGDGSIGIGHQLMKAGLQNMVFCPKTIDNDVLGTDQTFGFDTAVSVLTDALDKLTPSASAMDRAYVLEAMGRDSGFLALHSGLAGGADVILLPELEYDINAVLSTLEMRRQCGKKFSLIVAAEGARPLGGERAVLEEAANPYEDPRLGGISSLIAKQIEAGVGIPTRPVVLGHVQRGGSPTHTDRILATRYGLGAVDLIKQQKFGEVVALRNNKITSIPVTEVAKGRKTISMDSELVRCAEAMGVCLGR